MKKIAIYDFDKTLISIDSIVHFFLYLSSVFDIEDFDKEIIPFEIQNDTFNLLNKFKKISSIEGIPKNILERHIKIFVKNKLIPCINKDVFDILTNDIKKKDTDVFVVSASLQIILELFFKDLFMNNINIIATELSIKNDVYTGDISGLNCSGLNKLIMLKNKVNLDEYDLRNSSCYSDHISDVPILSLVERRYVIHSKKTTDDWSNYFKCQIINCM